MLKMCICNLVYRNCKLFFLLLMEFRSLCIDDTRPSTQLQRNRLRQKPQPAATRECILYIAR